jgi:hypothetical protein
MFLTVVNATTIKPDISDYLRAVVSKAGDYSATRNKIIHGDVLTVDTPESKHFKKTIILQGRQHWVADPPDDEVITSEDLVNARDHFAALATFNIIGLNWNTNPDESPLRFVESIRALPNPPHSKQLDPNVLGSYTLYNTDLQFRR